MIISTGVPDSFEFLAISMLRRLLDCGPSTAKALGSVLPHFHTLCADWLAVKELKVSYHKSETISFTMYSYSGNLNIPLSISPLKEPFKGNLGFPI